MKKAVLLLLAFSLLFVFTTGCATKEYVKQQIDPLVDRISKLEARVSAEAAARRAEAAADRAEAAAAKAAKAFELKQKK